ncbi:hypothetical protein [Celerinatantimonas sp. MCCC 1A17872]|uniref:hypothetical protein n=1 Tax=Celerinatantimonas sp. MCCC 1A17872 TaxID=3177514 RepID=UPI0038C694BB
MENIDYVAWWGALLSTLLAIVKLYELWTNRFRIDIGKNLTSEEELGNQIFIRNLSSKPVILEYWVVVYKSGIWPRRKFEYIVSPEECATDVQILPNSSKTLSFNGPDHFLWDSKTLNGRKIYIKLYIAGRRKFYKKVCD